MKEVENAGDQLSPEQPETDLIWQLYEEVAGGKRP